MITSQHLFSQRTTVVDNKGTLISTGVTVTEAAAAPTSPAPIEGDVWIDTTSNLTKVYDGTSWKVDNKFWLDQTDHFTAATAVSAANNGNKIHIEPTGSIAAVAAAALEDGFSTYIINHQGTAQTIPFTGFAGVFELNTSKANITADASFELAYLEAAILTVTENGGNKYLNISRFGGSSVSIWDNDEDTGVELEESADEDKIRFDTAGTERMIIDDEGLVGIGTATPSVPFEVIGEGDFRTVYISDNTSAASTVSAQGTTVIDDGDWAADASNTQWYLAKLSDNTTARSGSNQVVITDAGSLGLGTTSPTDKLHLDGNMRVTGTFKDASGDVELLVKYFQARQQEPIGLPLPLQTP
jgi:hypothetical protein